MNKHKTTLRKNQVLAYPTESCYGLGCNPWDANALKKVIRLKKRPQHKGMIVVGAHFKQLQALLAPLPADTQAALQHAWQQADALTILLPAHPRVLPLLRGKHKTLAVRVSKHPIVQRLCQQYGPLVSTSANHSGHQSAKTSTQALRLFGRYAKVIHGRVGKRKKPSTIMDWQTKRILR